MKLHEGKAVPRPLPRDISRFLKYVRVEGDHWFWTGHRDPKGYGQFWNNGSSRWAHRFAYAAFVAPVPQGLTIEHTCRCTSCVNPEHLTLLSHSENSSRRPSLQESEPPF